MSKSLIENSSWDAIGIFSRGHLSNRGTSPFSSHSLQKTPSHPFASSQDSSFTTKCCQKNAQWTTPTVSNIPHLPKCQKNPGPSQVSTKLKQPKIYTGDPEKTPWTPQIPVLSNGRWLTNHWLYHWPFKLPCSTRFAPKKKNYNFQLQIHFISFFLECLTSHSQV